MHLVWFAYSEHHRLRQCCIKCIFLSYTSISRLFIRLRSADETTETTVHNVQIRIRAIDCISFAFIRLSSNDDNNNNQFDTSRVPRRHYILHSRRGPNTTVQTVLTVSKRFAAICTGSGTYIANVGHLLDGVDGCLVCICISVVVIIIIHRCQQIDELRTCVHSRANEIRVNIHKSNSNNQHINTIIILFCGRMVWTGVRFHICRNNFPGGLWPTGLPVSRMLAIDTIDRQTKFHKPSMFCLIYQCDALESIRNWRPNSENQSFYEVSESDENTHYRK